MNLFETEPQGKLGSDRPLPERMRPRTLNEFVGQKHLVAEGKPLRQRIESDNLESMVFWGPPGVGKTSLARVIAKATHCEFISFSGVMSSIKEVKGVLVEAQRLRRVGRRTIVFVDEIHRFNKAQQDAFLPYVERGDIILIGATTENPSFEVIAALLSRTKVFTLEPLDTEALVHLQQVALRDPERGLANRGPEVPASLLNRIAVFAGGDARVALLAIEALANAANSQPATEALLEEVLQTRLPRYDKHGDEHFNVISALHKSVRSSDPDAALYWLACMLEAGEDRLYIGRRLVRMAAEDIGLADPRAVETAMAAIEAFRLVGEPEGDLFLAEVAVYLAVAPKSDAIYKGLGKARQELRSGPTRTVPLHLRNAPTGLMSDLGFAKGYQHAHEQPDAMVGMSCMPEGMEGTRYYEPTDRGVEERIAKRLRDIRARRDALRRAERS